MNLKSKWASLALMAFLGAMATNAHSQTAYPKKPLKIVVPFGAGGVADLTARTVAQKLGENLGQSIVIENKPGAGGVVATDAVAKSAPDGYTLLLMSNATAVSAGLFKTLPYDAEKDLTPLSVLGTFDIAIVVPQESKFTTLQDLLKFAKANPGKLNIGSINVGSTQHLAAELFKATAGIDAQVVPFNGTPAVLTALRGGQIDLAVEILAPVLPQIKGQALRALAVTGTKRHPQVKDIPTLEEMGLKGFDAQQWYGVVGPANMPAPIVKVLNDALLTVLAQPDFKEKLSSEAVELMPMRPAEFAAYMKADLARWTQLAKARNIQLDS